MTPVGRRIVERALDRLFKSGQQIQVIRPPFFYISLEFHASRIFERGGANVDGAGNANCTKGFRAYVDA